MGLWTQILKTFSTDTVIAATVTAAAQLGATAFAAHESKKSSKELLRNQQEQQKLDDARVAYDTGRARAAAAKELRVKVALANSELAGRGIGAGSSAYNSITALESNTQGTLADISVQEKFNDTQSDINETVFQTTRKTSNRAANADTISSGIRGIASMGVAINNELPEG